MGGDGGDVHSIQSIFTRLYSSPPNYLTVPYPALPGGAFETALWLEPFPLHRRIKSGPKLSGELKMSGFVERL
jgi:hypothetical protein